MSGNIMAEIKNDEQVTSDWLLLYFERRRDYYESRTNLQYSSQAPAVGGRSGVGKPTEQKTIMLSKLMHDEAWLETVEYVQERLSDRKKIFLKVRREAAYMDKNIRGRPAWVVYVQQNYAEEMSKITGRNPEEFWLSEATVKAWWKKLVNLLVIVAMKKRCL